MYMNTVGWNEFLQYQQQNTVHDYMTTYRAVQGKPDDSDPTVGKCRRAMIYDPILSENKLKKTWINSV